MGAPAAETSLKSVPVRRGGPGDAERRTAEAEPDFDLLNSERINRSVETGGFWSVPKVYLPTGTDPTVAGGCTTDYAPILAKQFAAITDTLAEFHATWASTSSADRGSAIEATRTGIDAVLETFSSGSHDIDADEAELGRDNVYLRMVKAVLGKALRGDLGYALEIIAFIVGVEHSAHKGPPTRIDQYSDKSRQPGYLSTQHGLPRFDWLFAIFARVLTGTTKPDSLRSEDCEDGETSRDAWTKSMEFGLSHFGQRLPLDLDRVSIGRLQMAQFKTDTEKIFGDMLLFDDNFGTHALDGLISRWIQTLSHRHGFPLRPFPIRAEATKVSKEHKDDVPAIPVPGRGPAPSHSEEGARVAILGEGSALSRRLTLHRRSSPLTRDIPQVVLHLMWM